MSEKFEGFEPANTTPVPDVLFDELLPTLKEAELKALLYIIRRTLGFKKSTDAISLTQFQKGIKTKDGRQLDLGCGVKDRTTLIKALSSLVTKGCIDCVKAKTTSGDDDITLYRIRFREVVGNFYHPQSEGSGQFLPPVVGNSYHGSGQTRPRVVGNSHPQETVLQQTDLQETDNNLDSNVESANADIDATHKSSPPSKNAGERTPSKENKKSNETAQPSLIEIPAGPPTIPAKDAKWTAETLVQITEAKLGKRYQEFERRFKGKLCKTQRQRQLEAAEAIIKAGFSREEFERAYDHRNDDWWKQVKGDLTVENMVANTERKVMRLVEELEKTTNQANRKPNRPGNQGSTVQHGQRPEDYEKSPISQNNTEHLRKLLASRGVASAATAETKGA